MAIVSGSCARISGSRNGPSVSATQSGSVGQSQPMIAVWEWQDDLGCWRPYSGQVSAYIEQCLARRGHRGGGPGSTSICLGQSDPNLSPYIIDVRSLKQFRQDTGECEYRVTSSFSLPVLRRRDQGLASACLFPVGHQTHVSLLKLLTVFMSFQTLCLPGTRLKTNKQIQSGRGRMGVVLTRSAV